MGTSSILMRLSGWFATSRSRKLILLLVIFLVFFSYIGPWIMHHSWTDKVTLGCLTLQLKDLEDDMLQVDASVYHADKPDVHADHVIPFVGNGKIGIVADVLKPKGFLLKNDDMWMGVAMYHPLVTAKLTSRQDQSLTVLHYRKANVRRYQCYSVGESCIFVKTATLVHRFRPSLMLEEVVVENNVDQPVSLELSRSGPVKWKGASTTTEMLMVDGTNWEYLLTVGDLSISGSSGNGHPKKVITVVIAATTFEKTIQVPAKSVSRKRILTMVKYSAPHDASTPKVTAGLMDEVNDELFRILHLNFQDLVKEHEDAWSQQIWNTGLTQEPLAMTVHQRVSKDFQQHVSAVHVLNVLTTAVMYYMMSSIQAPLLLASTTLQRKKEVINVLQHPGSCFNGQPTLFEGLLWNPVGSEKDLSDLLSHWQHVLYKHGCHSLLSVGVTGVMQAMMLSFLAGQFTERELSFHADPLLFHNKFHLRSIYYNNSFLRIDIDPSPAHQVSISVISAQSTGSTTPLKLYACGTGCEGTPILLTSTAQKLPLKWTVPQTPFLYISHDPKHLAYLKTKIIHYRHLYDLDDSDISALMPVVDEPKNKHHTVQLPVILWIIILSLIIAFHAYLLNMVYKEYCSDSSSSGSRNLEKTSKA